MTKRIAAVFLCLVLCLSLSGTAFAAMSDTMVEGGATAVISAEAEGQTLALDFDGVDRPYSAAVATIQRGSGRETAIVTFNVDAGASTLTFDTLKYAGGDRLRVYFTQAGQRVYVPAPAGAGNYDADGFTFIVPEAEETPGEYTVTLDANGGKFSNNLETASATTAGGRLTAEHLANQPSREGYTFAGWNTRADGAGDAVTTETAFTEDSTIFAQWTEDEAETFTVQIIAGENGSIVGETSKTVEEGGSATFTVKPNSGFRASSAAVSPTGAASASVSGTTVTVSAVNADCTVTVSFAKTSGGGGSGGGGGGGGTSGGLTVTTPRPQHGTFSVSPSRPGKGDTVTVTLRPDKGYELDSLTVKDENGRTVSVKKAADNQYTFVMPDSDVTVTVTYKPIAEPEAPAAPSFADVAPGTFYGDIMWAAEKGYMGGYGDGTFRPNANTTRQALWMVLARLDGANPADMAGARDWAVANGISDGTRPGEAMTRQQMVTMLYRYAQAKGWSTGGGVSIDSFPDASGVSSYAREAMSWAVGSGIVNGTSQGTLNPGGPALRSHFAAFLHRFCVNAGIA